MKNKIKKIWNAVGPGLITGCSDDDPSGIATYTQAGAKLGLSMLWTAFITYPLMYYIQEMCARIGIVTGLSLTTVIKNNYSKFFLYLLILTIFPAITFNIAANLAGMGAVAHLLIPFISPLAFSLIFTVILISTLFFCSYNRFANILKWLCIILVVYFIVPFLIKQDWHKILLATFIPYLKWDKDFITMLVAILGTTISPYLFLWQSDMSVEEKQHKFCKSDQQEIRIMKTDVNIGMLFSNLVMFFIILTAGTVLFPAGITHIETVEDAAIALKPLAGEFAYIIFAIGIIGTGCLAIPILAGCLGYLFAEIFNWKKGLDKTPKEAKGFYGIMLASMVIALLLNILQFNPIQALIYTAIFYGVIAPFLIAMILHISNSKTIMGEFVNGWLSNIFGIATLILMTGAAIALFVLN